MPKVKNPPHKIRPKGRLIGNKTSSTSWVVITKSQSEGGR